MNKTIKYLGLLLILPLFTVALTTNFAIDAEAAKGQGVPTKSYGSKTQVCGDRLCSEIPGGKAGFESGNTSTQTTVPPKEKPAMKDESMKSMEKPAMKDDHMKDDHMKDDNMKDKSMKSMEAHKESSGLKLSRANVPATIPLHHGFYDGGDVYYIITDASDPKHADVITEQQGWKVELAPLLANAPEEALSTTYFFTNGVKGDGIHGYQGQVFTSTPAQPEMYSGLTSHIHVTWTDASKARLLMSEEDILNAEKAGEVALSPLPVVINMPQIVWPDGQMMVKEDKTLTDKTPYGGGQVLDIDTEEMTVTFIAHRGWGPDGRTIYYIVTDATPSGPAEMMGVVYSPTSASLLANSGAVDLFQFMNGLKGTGPLGFQPGIAAGAPGDENYSPMWRIFLVGWEDPHHAKLLETTGDINYYKEAGKLKVNIAKPMDSDHIVNCPFIDPFQ
ncbi:MAG: hypothetical protein DWQ18_03795 [Crenarchaeota archaeon]|nr:MAG: hypothetical protein DWQ17_09335 [Thermoproteota archaeon]RDJ34035.1 MAG: hypothetical protein DWQ18_03795 [Thermoproteota archaeon]RDJ36851.1 MAG: hypothetical protein DWQ13_06820 [Thermoproteota archaeon]RDJ37615.1 MAG: hypothetical protein DWQ19_04015 [Thermoproteota archaeon]